MTDNEFDSVIIEANLFIFSFLPGFTIDSPEIILTFDREINSEVQILGLVNLGGTDFETKMLKGFDEQYYVISRSKIT